MVTFVVEDGTGLPSATSYVSLAEADDYFAVDLNYAATWSAFTDTQKQDRLMWASRILDQKVRWKGTLFEEGVGLRWPREGVFDRDDIAIDTDVVPPQVKAATCELTKYLEDNDPTTGGDVDFIKRAQVDVLEVEFQDGTSQNSFPTILNAILRNVGTFVIGTPRTLRIVKV